MDTYDLIIVGEGIAGLACAEHAANHGLKTATIEAKVFGGLVINVAKLSGYEPIAGVELASRLMETAADAGVTSLNATVEAVSGSRGEFRVLTNRGEFGARAVVLASGARLGKLDVPGEAELAYRGVSQCADCDGPLFKGEYVVVAGGGDAAFTEALVLADFADKVAIAMRGDTPRARPELIAEVRSHPRIEVMPRTVIERILGSERVEGVHIRRNGETADMKCAGVFVFVGLVPNSDMAPASVTRAARGHIETTATFETSLPGLFAIGAVRDGYSGRLVDAVSEAKTVAQDLAGSLAVNRG